MPLFPATGPTGATGPAGPGLDVVTFDPAGLKVAIGAASIALDTSMVGLSLADGATSGGGSTFKVPSGWSSVNIVIDWYTQDTDTGHTSVWRLDQGKAAIGGAVPAYTNEATVSVNAPGVSRQLVSTTLKSGLAVTAGDLIGWRVVSLNTGTATSRWVVAVHFVKAS